MMPPTMLGTGHVRCAGFLFWDIIGMLPPMPIGAEYGSSIFQLGAFIYMLPLTTLKREHIRPGVVLSDWFV